MPQTTTEGWEVSDDQNAETAQKLIEASRRNRSKLNPSRLKKYALISMPRTGSTLFSEALRSPGEMGWPHEWFNLQLVQKYLQAKGTTNFNCSDYVLDLYFGSVNMKTHIFGLNFHIEQYLFWKKEGLDLFDLGFDKIYYLDRKNSLQQAYSWAKAQSGGVWNSQIGDALKERSGAAQNEARVSLSEFTNRLHIICECHDVYDQDIRSKVSREFLYRDIVKDGAIGAVNAIRQDFGLSPIKDQAAETGLTQQRTSVDEDNLKTMLNDLGAADLFAAA